MEQVQSKMISLKTTLKNKKKISWFTAMQISVKINRPKICLTAIYTMLACAMDNIYILYKYHTPNQKIFFNTLRSKTVASMQTAQSSG